MNVLDSVLHN